LAVKLAPPRLSQVEPVLARWSEERKARPSAEAARAYMHSIAKLRAGISKVRHALLEQWLAAQHWAPVSALPQVANEPQQSAQARAQGDLISTRVTRVASVITDVTNLINCIEQNGGQ